MYFAPLKLYLHYDKRKQGEATDLLLFSGEARYSVKDLATFMVWGGLGPAAPHDCLISFVLIGSFLSSIIVQTDKMRITQALSTLVVMTNEILSSQS